MRASSVGRFTGASPAQRRQLLELLGRRPDREPWDVLHDVQDVLATDGELALQPGAPGRAGEPRRPAAS
jgi:hypothetical protein